MVALAAVVGREIAIRPKALDSWEVVANLLGAAVGNHRLPKSPALQGVREPLDRLEARAREAYERDHETESLISEQQQRFAKEAIRQALKEGRDARNAAVAAGCTEQSAPARRRYLTHDSTVERLGELLRDNPRGVLVFRDELTGFLRTMDREGHEGDRAFYLESWNGTGRFTVDRIGRGCVDVPALCVSILGGIQPGSLSVYVVQMARGGGGDDGPLQRFQLLVWPDPPGPWLNVDRLPDAEARRRTYEVFERLDRIDPDSVGATVPEGGGLPFRPFGPEAQELFTEWRTELEGRLRRGDLEAHLAKYRSLIPTLALLGHFADAGGGAVGLGALRRACGWGDFLGSHARRVHSAALSPASSAARALEAHIRRGDLGRGFALQEVQRRQ